MAYSKMMKSSKLSTAYAVITSAPAVYVMLRTAGEHIHHISSYGLLGAFVGTGLGLGTYFAAKTYCLRTDAKEIKQDWKLD
ncbi:MAG: hypothetical protein KGH66_00835 [Candidatus Micrarchaeota archaeon]|nr:hypothetical protein [Candidatus Micrarchaeota archaeon]